MADPENYCPELWQRIYINQVNQNFSAKPCCYAQPYEGNEVLITDSKRIFQTYNEAPQIQLLRRENTQGRLGVGCEVCRHAEQAVGSSGRTRAVERALGDKVIKLTRHVDLNLGNLCNLACAICDPHSSTSWAPIYQKMQGRPWTIINYDKHDRPVIDDPSFFANIDTLQLQGGEVFLQSAYTDFFRNLSQHRDLSQISVVIFTNGTTLPSPDLWQMLNQCGQVELFFSIDDMASRFEYQRHGAKWPQVLENVRWFQSNAGSGFVLGFHPTYSLLNIYYLAELQRFLQAEFPDFQRNWGPYHVGSGPCMADVLPAEIRRKILDQQQGIDELAFLSDYIREGSRDLASFFDYINRYDIATNKSYSSTHPEFWRVLSQP
jgi:hypothetical protein